MNIGLFYPGWETGSEKYRQLFHLAKSLNSININKNDSWISSVCMCVRLSVCLSIGSGGRWEWFYFIPTDPTLSLKGSLSLSLSHHLHNNPSQIKSALSGYKSGLSRSNSSAPMFFFLFSPRALLGSVPTSLMIYVFLTFAPIHWSFKKKQLFTWLAWKYSRRKLKGFTVPTDAYSALVVGGPDPPVCRSPRFPRPYSPTLWSTVNGLAFSVLSNNDHLQ